MSVHNVLRELYSAPSPSGQGIGGTVTQATNKSTGVTLSRSCGQITMNNAALGAGAQSVFVFTNTLIAATDVLLVIIQGGQATPGTYEVMVSGIAAGAATIVLTNVSAGSLSEAVVLNFAIIKAVSA